MKTISIWITLILTLAFIPCNAQNTSKQSASSTKMAGTSVNAEKVEAYYFHLTSRCPTCIAVESVAKKTIESLYAGKVTFKSINLDDASSKSIAEKLQVPGQALLIVKGGKQVNLTNEGFMYAKKDPEKFKSIIKEKVDALLL